MIIEILDLFETIFSMLSLVSFFVSPILSAAGIIRKKPAWLLASAVMVLPISIHFWGRNDFMGFGIFLPLFQLGAAAAVHKRVAWLAWLFLIPLISIISLWSTSIILYVVIIIYFSRKLILYLINSILKDRNRVIILFVSSIIFILLNMISIIADESDLFNMLFIFFIILPNKYFIKLLFPALVYIGRNRIRSTIDRILKSPTKKNIFSLILIALLVFFINATFKHFFWDDILIGHLYLSGPPYDRIILLLVPIVFPLLTGFEIWNKTRNISDALLAWILTVWVFILFSYPEPHYSFLL